MKDRQHPAEVGFTSLSLIFSDHSFRQICFHWTHPEKLGCCGTVIRHYTGWAHGTNLTCLCFCFCCEQIISEWIALLGMNHIIKSKLWQNKEQSSSKCVLNINLSIWVALGKWLLIRLMHWQTSSSTLLLLSTLNPCWFLWRLVVLDWFMNTEWSSVVQK